MKTLIVVLALGVILLFGFLYFRQEPCRDVAAKKSYGNGSYVRPGQMAEFLCAGVGPPIRPNTAETNPNYAQPSQSKRLCQQINQVGAGMAASSSDPNVRKYAGIVGAEGFCDLAGAASGAVQDIWKGATDLFGDIF